MSTAVNAICEREIWRARLLIGSFMSNSGYIVSSFVGVVENTTMDEAGGYGNVPASTGKGYA